jgi:hypothetical protein
MPTTRPFDAQWNTCPQFTIALRIQGRPREIENGSTNAFFTTGAFFCRAAVALGLVVCLKTLLIVGVGDRTSPVAVLPFLRSTLLLFGIDVS